MSETSIHIHAGSILDVRADAIVNPANSFFDHKGGLACVIAEAAAGPFLIGDLRQYHTDLDGSPCALIRAARDAHNDRVTQWLFDHENAPLVATGNAYHTSPGNLPYVKGVIHVVGPIWNGGDFMERDLLEMAHESVLRTCQEHGYTSVVFPAISCGVFGFPVEEAAGIAAEVACWGIDYGVKDVTFALMDNKHIAAYITALSDRTNALIIPTGGTK